MRILLKSHPEGLWYVSKIVLLACVYVVYFQVITSAEWLRTFHGGEVNAIAIGMAVVFFAVEYVLLEVFKNEWDEDIADSKLSKTEIATIVAILIAFAIVAIADGRATYIGAMVRFNNKIFCTMWAIGQLLLAEILFHMHFWLRDKSEQPSWWPFNKGGTRRGGFENA